MVAVSLSISEANLLFTEEMDVSGIKTATVAILFHLKIQSSKF